MRKSGRRRPAEPAEAGRTRAVDPPDSPGGTLRRRIYALLLTSTFVLILTIAGGAVFTASVHVPAANAEPAVPSQAGAPLRGGSPNPLTVAVLDAVPAAGAAAGATRDRGATGVQRSAPRPSAPREQPNAAAVTPQISHAVRPGRERRTLDQAAGEGDDLGEGARSSAGTGGTGDGDARPATPGAWAQTVTPPGTPTPRQGLIPGDMHVYAAPAPKKPGEEDPKKGPTTQAAQATPAPGIGQPTQQLQEAPPKQDQFRLGYESPGLDAMPIFMDKIYNEAGIRQGLIKSLGVDAYNYIGLGQVMKAGTALVKDGAIRPGGWWGAGHESPSLVKGAIRGFDNPDVPPSTLDKWMPFAGSAFQSIMDLGQKGFTSAGARAVAEDLPTGLGATGLALGGVTDIPVIGAVTGITALPSFLNHAANSNTANLSGLPGLAYYEGVKAFTSLAVPILGVVSPIGPVAAAFIGITIDSTFTRSGTWGTLATTLPVYFLAGGPWGLAAAAIPGFFQAVANMLPKGWVKDAFQLATDITSFPARMIDKGINWLIDTIPGARWAVDGITNGLRSVVTTVFNAIGSVANSVWNSLVSAWNSIFNPSANATVKAPDGQGATAQANGKPAATVGPPNGRAQTQEKQKTAALEEQPQEEQQSPRPGNNVFASADDFSLIDIKADPDERTEHLADGSVRTTNTRTGTVVTVGLDGVSVEVRLDGTTITTSADGKEVTTKDAYGNTYVESKTTRIFVFTDAEGNSTSYYPDGTKMVYNAGDRSRTITNLDGSVTTVRSAGYGTTVMPNGDLVYENADGSTTVVPNPNSQSPLVAEAGPPASGTPTSARVTNPAEVTVASNGDVTATNNTGATATVTPDGALITQDPDGNLTGITPVNSTPANPADLVPLAPNSTPVSDQTPTGAGTSPPVAQTDTSTPPAETHVDTSTPVNTNLDAGTGPGNNNGGSTQMASTNTSTDTSTNTPTSDGPTDTGGDRYAGSSFSSFGGGGTGFG